MMSGICGLVSSELAPQTLEQNLEQMAAALPLLKGVGRTSLVADSQAGLGLYEQFASSQQTAWLHRGADIRPAGVFQDSRLLLVCEGEVYNATELKSSFNGGTYAGEARAELMAALYCRDEHLEWMDQIRGVFALAIWDVSRQRLVLATDRFGVRPLVYYQDHRKLVFGSRLNAIVRAGAPREVDLNAVFQYLFFNCIPTPNTIYRNVRKLPPAHYLEFSEGEVKVQPYWRMRFEEDYSRRPSYFTTGIRERLQEAVRLQATFSEEPESIGSFLSGGTDSSTISGLLGRTLDRPARTFSIGFAEHQFNEIEYARVASRHFGTRHHEYFVTPEDTAAVIPQIVQAYDEPFGNASAIPTYYCSRLAQQNGVNVLLAGDGGDELFGGNSRYALDKLLEIYQHIPRWIRSGIESALFAVPWLDRCPLSAAHKYIRRSNIPQPRRYFSYNLIYTVDLREMLRPEFLAAVSQESPLAIAREYYEGAGNTTLLNRLLHIDLKIVITDNDLRKVTRMCELANVRVRYPMLDTELVEFSGTIPAGLKVKRFDKRHIFKLAYKEFLPPEVIAKKKHGFGLPISHWLKDVPRLRELAQDTMLSQASRQRGYFKADFLEKLFELHRSDTTNFFGDNLWVLLMLELWHQTSA
jgi:asparagine synthase (glutamine-hydrolysing)